MSNSTEQKPSQIIDIENHYGFTLNQSAIDFDEYGKGFPNYSFCLNEQNDIIALSICENGIEDLSIIANLTSMVYLALWGNNI